MNGNKITDCFPFICHLFTFSTIKPSIIISRFELSGSTRAYPVKVISFQDGLVNLFWRFGSNLGIPVYTLQISYLISTPWDSLFIIFFFKNVKDNYGETFNFVLFLTCNIKKEKHILSNRYINFRIRLHMSYALRSGIKPGSSLTCNNYSPKARWI